MSTSDTRDLEPAALASWLNGEADHQERIAARYKAASTFRAIYSRRAEILRSCARALSEPAAPAGAEVVKALEWRERGDGTEFAVTDFGLLYVASDLGWGTRNYPDKNPVTGGISAAKAAAQADYEARIRSALTHPAPADKGVEQ
jgi:hypothetical protein